MGRFRELTVFRRNHGHCNVPKKYAGGTLGVWVNVQRQDKRKQIMHNERVVRLEGLGFQWNVLTDLWEARFRELAVFMQEHGHCNIPRKYAGGLGMWVKNQRKKKKSQSLDADRNERLEELGFQWEVTRMLHDQSDARLRWDARFRELQEFVEAYGTSEEPQRHPGGLGKWVCKQRYMGAEKLGRLDASRVEKLEELGFRWGNTEST